MPTCEQELEAFAKELTDSYRKTSHLREALMSSWYKMNLDYRCMGSTQANTLLHVAARMGEAKLVAALCHVQSDANVRNADGDAPLHLAAEHDRPLVIEALLKHQVHLSELSM